MTCPTCPMCKAKCESTYIGRKGPFSGRHVHYHKVGDAKDARGRPVWATHNWSDVKP